MGLDDREQRILAEIERQFYEEDPDLADAVRNITRVPITAKRFRLAIAAAIAGLVMLIWTFPRSTILAAIGFLILVGSLFVVVQAKRPAIADRRRMASDPVDD